MNFSPINRRNFFRIGSRVATLALLSDCIPAWVRQALADEAGATHSEGPNFILLRPFGDSGMDATLGLDPQILAKGVTSEDCFIEYRPEEILEFGSLRLGPAAAPLAPFADSCSSVNGIMMRRDAGHFPGLLYITTGRGDGKAGAVPAELMLSLGGGPFGLVMNTAIYLAGKSALVSTTKELSDGGTDAELIQLIEQKTKASLPQGTPIEAAEKAVLKAQEKAGELFAFLKQMEAQYGKLGEIHILVAAMATGATRHAQLELTTPVGLDTHSQHERNHLTGQKAFWQQTADLLKLLKETPFEKGSLLDRTLVMAACEFSRTPALNAAKGKDHNPYTNSVLLAGAGVKGRNTVGKSQIIPLKKSKTGMPEHYAVPFNYAEGKPATSPVGASFFYPENLVRTIAKLYGDPPGFTSVDYKLPPIPGLLS